MCSNWPEITVVTPVYNAASFIEASIESVLAQGYPELQYIVIDGGSTDGTVDILRKYEGSLSYWESKPDRGQTHALNKGFRMATGVLRGWLNADEEYLPGTLRCVAEEYMSSENLDLIYGDRYHDDLTLSPPSRTEERIPDIAPFQLMFYTGRILFTDATFWTKHVHNRVGELNEKEYPRYAMDAEWLLRVTGAASKAKHLARPLSVFKYHGGNVTTEGVNRGLRYNEQIRHAYAAAHGISTLNIALGWLWYSARLRLLEKGPIGALMPPRWDTIAYLFLKKYRHQGGKRH